MFCARAGQTDVFKFVTSNQVGLPAELGYQ